MKIYGKDFDFSRPFFEQFAELIEAVPTPHIITEHDVEKNNCIYTNYAGNNKNCYLVFDSDFNEDCMYSNILGRSKSSMECSIVAYCELLYECTDCINCYNVKYSQDCTNCSDSFFLKNCIGVRNSIGCINLRQKEYCIFNVQYTKEEYEKKFAEFPFHDRNYVKEFQVKFEEYSKQFPVKNFHGNQTENSTGDYLYNTANALESFNCVNVKDVKYCDSLINSVDCMDTSSFGEKIELVYECGTIGLNTSRTIFCHYIANDSFEIAYSLVCRSSNNLFGCVGLGRSKYCILNKQYTKEEYEELVPKIIEHMKSTGEWGEYFLMTISPFAYNETIAQEKFPLTKEECLEKNLTWKDEENTNAYQGINTEVPASILDADESIISKILTCTTLGKMFKITKQEFDFYKKWNIPLPDECPDARHQKRIQKRNGVKLISQKCVKCKASIVTTYGPEYSDRIHCENCFNNLIN